MEPTVWDNISAAIDFTAPIAVIGTAGVALAGAYVVRKGIRMALSMFSK